MTSPRFSLLHPSRGRVRLAAAAIWEWRVFNSETVTASTPTLLCLPVDVDGGGISNPAAAVTCYATTTTGTAPGTVAIDDRFGAGTVDVGLPTGVCVPTIVTSIVPTP